jgi:hypothetical protein
MEQAQLGLINLRFNKGGSGKRNGKEPRVLQAPQGLQTSEAPQGLSPIGSYHLARLTTLFPRSYCIAEFSQSFDSMIQCLNLAAREIYCRLEIISQICVLYYDYISFVIRRLKHWEIDGMIDWEIERLVLENIHPVGSKIQIFEIESSEWNKKWDLSLDPGGRFVLCCAVQDWARLGKAGQGMQHTADGRQHALDSKQSAISSMQWGTCIREHSIESMHSYNVRVMPQ